MTTISDVATDLVGVALGVKTAVDLRDLDLIDRRLVELVEDTVALQLRVARELRRRG